MYMNTAAFSIEYSIPISVFGDAVSLSFQNYIIIYLVWKFNDKISQREKWMVGLSYALILLMLLVLPLTNRIWDMILDLSTFLSKFLENSF